MTTYISLAVREYAEGRVLISTDRMGGFWTAHGLNERSMWRKSLEWTGKRFASENINIAVIESYKVDTLNYLNLLAPTSYQTIDLQYIAQNDLSSFDLLYFIGLPPLVSTEVSEKIEAYVKDGGGLFIENPDRGGENINILSSIEDIYCASSDRPTFSNAYWSITGESHYIYEAAAKTYFYTTLELSAFSEDWNLLTTSAPVVLSPLRVFATASTANLTYAHASSEFGVGYVCAFKNGIVTLEEELGSSSSSSSSSVDSSSSSSSSSYLDPDHWSICDSLVAQWKMNDNYNTKVVWNATGDMGLMGFSYANTSSKHVTGIINGALSFNGTNDYIYVTANTDLNFTDGISDSTFSISMWVKPVSIASGYLLKKIGSWNIYVVAGAIYVKLENGVNYRIAQTANGILSAGVWSHLVITYDAIGFSGIKIYVNGTLISTSGSDSGYSTMSNASTLFDIGTDAAAIFYSGSIDNVLVVNRVLTNIEIEALYGRGSGTEDCEGDYIYTSSSSSSSMEYSSSSSSSSSP